MRRMLAAWCGVLVMTTAVWAGGPREVVQASVERAAAIAKDSEPAAREQLKAVAADLFDFEELSRRTLARHWASLSLAERDEFVRLYSALLEHAYLARIEDFSSDKLVWVGETVDGGFASVRSKVVTPRGELPVEYRLHLRDGRWRVYDLAIDGMSFVSMYRSQFDRILRTEPFDGLLEKLRRRTLETAGIQLGAQSL